MKGSRHASSTQIPCRTTIVKLAATTSFPVQPDGAAWHSWERSSRLWPLRFCRLAPQQPPSPCTAATRKGPGSTKIGSVFDQPTRCDARCRSVRGTSVRFRSRRTRRIGRLPAEDLVPQAVRGLRAKSRIAARRAERGVCAWASRWITTGCPPG